MSDNEIKPEIMWAIWNPEYGFYVDTRLTRSGMIRKHTFDLGKTWRECRKDGDRCIKVVISPAPRPHQ